MASPSLPLSPAPTAGEAPARPLTAERYTELLYPRLAWEATLRLGDPSTAGRLVERVLYRAWRERERFAAADALLRHATESAEAAVAREEQRRLSVTRFDPDEPASGLPGDLSPLATRAVAERLRTGRVPAPTPPAGAPVVETPAPVATAPRTRASDEHAVAPAEARHSGRPTNGSAPPPRGSTATHRAPLRATRYMAPPPSPSRRVPLAIGAGAVLVAALGWRLLAGGPPAAERAWMAAADTTAPRLSAARGEFRDSVLATGLRVRLAPSSSVTVPAVVRDGVRGLMVTGAVTLEAAVDSAQPVVLKAGTARLESAGGLTHVRVDGDTVLLFAARGDVLHQAAARTRIAEGQAVRMLTTGEITPLSTDEAARAFAWTQGRLRVARGPARALREPLDRWFGIAVTATDGDSVALDVPLDSLEVLATALAAEGRRVTRDGMRWRLEPAAPAPAPRRLARRPVQPDTLEVAVPVLRKLPGVPAEPPLP